MRTAASAALVSLVLVLAGCGAHVPTDPDRSLEQLTDGVLRAGASPAGGLVEVDDTHVTGTLADLMAEFAESRGAQVRWTVASEEDLVGLLESDDLDVAIGGMTEETPWSDRVSVTRGYPDIPAANGRRVVVLLPLGENALQAALEAFLDERVRP